MKLNKIVNWVVSAGVHKAKIVDARIIENQKKGELRLIFQVTDLKHPTQKYQAKRCYDEAASAPLLEDLPALLGTRIYHVLGDDRTILEEGLHLLLGQTCPH